MFFEGGGTNAFSFISPFLSFSSGAKAPVPGSTVASDNAPLYFREQSGLAVQCAHPTSIAPARNQRGSANVFSQEPTRAKANDRNLRKFTFREGFSLNSSETPNAKGIIMENKKYNQ